MIQTGAFGHNHYMYHQGQRMQVGITRTIRPTAGESPPAFRQRIANLVQALLATGGILAVDEELRDGVLVQVIIRLQLPPTPAPPIEHDPSPVSTVRPSGPRGKPG